jgi:hypothetical protein
LIIGRKEMEKHVMKGTVKMLALCILPSLMAVPAAAVDVEVELRYSYNEATLSASGEEDMIDVAPGLGLRAEFAPSKRFALAAEYSRGNGEGSLDGADFSQVLFDIKWRVIAPSEDTFCAVGLGYQTLEISNGETLRTDGCASWRTVATDSTGSSTCSHVSDIYPA